MTFIKRADLGRPLTWDELDSNFQQVDSYAAAASASASAAQTQAQSSSQSAQQALQYQQAAETAAASAEGAVDDFKDELAAPGGASLVGYSFNGVADSVRTVLSKLRDSAANIEDFGAVGDGVTDDTPALQAAHDLLGYGSYIALSPGKTYVITGFTFTKIIALGCPYGRAAIKTTLGLRWDLSSDILDVVIENIDVYSTTIPSISNKVTALSFESAVKNYGVGGYTVVNNVIIKKDGNLAFYNGISFKNTPVIVDGCTIKLKESHNNPLAKDGTLAQWEANSGVGISIDGCTYTSIGNCKVYYARDAYLVKGQAEDVHLHGCFALLNRRCYVFESLVAPSNQQRINNCHGTTYFSGIEMAADGSGGRPVLCSIESTSIFASGGATAPQITYAKLVIDGGNINNFQAYNDGTRGANDIGIHLATVGGFRARRNIITGLHCRGVGTAVYLDAEERQFISNVSLLKTNMTGPNPVVYAYGPNNLASPVTTAYGIAEQANVFSKSLEAPIISGTTSIGLREPTTVSRLGVEKFKIHELSGNYRIESLDSGGVLQYNAGIDLSGTFRTKWLYPLTTNEYTLGSGAFVWAGGYTQTAFTVTSDETHKTKPLVITDTILDAAAEVDWVQYQYLDRVEEKGEDGARWHFGAIAQRFVEAFQKHGLDPFRFAFICYDEWDAEDEVVGEDGEIVSEAVSAGSRYGIRYEEALSLEAALQRRNYKRLVDEHSKLISRIEALENKS